MLDRSIEDELRELHEGTDVWAGVLPGQVLIPAYLASRFAARYRVVVDALLEVQDRSLTGMSFDDITAAVRNRLYGLLPPDTVARLLDEAVFHPEQRLDSLRLLGRAHQVAGARPFRRELPMPPRPSTGTSATSPCRIALRRSAGTSSPAKPMLPVGQDPAVGRIPADWTRLAVKPTCSS